MNIVLGGAGLIGKRLVELLHQRGEETCVYDLKCGFDLRFRTPEPVPNAYCWFLAWDVGGAKYILDETQQLSILQHNLLLCQNVFGWLKESQIPFTFTSTQMTSHPSAYGLTKSVGEFWAQQLPQSRVARLWNVYDAEPTTVRSHVIPDMISRARSGTISLMTTGEEQRQFLLADDCAEALIYQREIRQPLADITSGQWISIASVARMIGNFMGAYIVLGEKKGYESLTSYEHPLPKWYPKHALIEGLYLVADRMATEGVIQ